MDPLLAIEAQPGKQLEKESGRSTRIGQHKYRGEEQVTGEFGQNLFFYAGRYRLFDSLELQRELGALYLFRVFHAALPPDLVHDFHNNHALGKALVLAFLLAFDNSGGRLVGLPEHTMAFAFTIGSSSKAIVEAATFARPWLWPVLVLNSAICKYNPRLRWPVRGVEDLYLTLGTLHPNRRASSTLTIGVGTNSHTSHGDTMSVASLLFLSREPQQHGRLLVCSGAVLLQRGHDLWWHALLLWLSMVKSLEDPSQGIDTKVEQGSSSEIWVDHAVLAVWILLLWILGH
jgi:hypothetical protein